MPKKRGALADAANAAARIAANKEKPDLTSSVSGNSGEDSSSSEEDVIVSQTSAKHTVPKGGTHHVNTASKEVITLCTFSAYMIVI